MCGIAGWLDKNIDLTEKISLLSKMSKTLEQRGPDENGMYIRHEAALIHRRLTVIDKESGKQPMMTKHKDKVYCIVYNGELYNTEELRHNLIEKGHKFKGKSDTEVVLKAYTEYKEKCCEMLNGIYAFAIYDINEKKLFLCRDKIGVKPLFFYEYSDGLLFSSEIKTMLASGIVKPVLDENGLYEVLFLGPARTPGNGIFKGVKELLPGEYAVYKNGILTRKKYFKITAKEHTDNEKQTIEKTRFLLTDAVERQLVSDVPLCFFLSGGLDSSIIVKTASDFHKRNKLDRISTYSVEYKDNMKYFEKSLFQPNADVDYIDIMVQNANTIHHQVILDNSELADALFPAVTARDLPGMADIDSSLLLFCRQVKENYTVALSGECADELFGGYPWYHNKEILFEECFPWSRSQKIRRDILNKGILPKGEEYVHQKYLDTISLAEKLPTDTKLSARMREMFILNFYWFMQCLLDRKDRCSMFSGLEVRVPFCDYRLVEYAYNMPWELKAYKGREKGIVRKAFEDILPEEICWRKKSPYPKTHNPIYMQAVTRLAENALNKKGSLLNELINKDSVYEIINHPEEISSPWYGQLMRAPQILAYIAQLDYWFEKYNINVE
ncbi:MAG: asparagine synthase (glutamine-hydrolyzing) [Ruminococcus sp.]